MFSRNHRKCSEIHDDIYQSNLNKIQFHCNIQYIYIVDFMVRLYFDVSLQIRWQSPMFQLPPPWSTLTHVFQLPPFYRTRGPQSFKLQIARKRVITHCRQALVLQHIWIWEYASIEIVKISRKISIKSIKSLKYRI